MAHLAHRRAATRPQPAFFELVRRACEQLVPVHGYAGLGLCLPPGEFGQGRSTEAAVGYAARFKGLGFGFPLLDLAVLSEEERIRGINWLTILSDEWIDRLGGKDELQQKLGPEIDNHPYGAGVVIQAGPHPRFGDVNRAEPMAHYQTVARALAVQELRPLAHFFGFDQDRTAQWLARFDA